MKALKIILIASYIAIVAVMAVATIFEKLLGTPFATNCIYGTWWFASIWTMLATSGLAYCLKTRLFRRPFNFLMHTAFIIILTGALATHILGQQGTLHVRVGEPASVFFGNNMQQFSMPFNIELESFDIENYPGTQSPMDYVSKLKINDGLQHATFSVSMNNVAEHHGYRFYQSGYDPDHKGSYLSVSHDPVGIGITYAGYALLFLSMLALLVMPNESFRKMLKKVSQNKLSAIAIGLIFCTLSANATNDGHQKQTLPHDIAEQFGELHIYSNGRICPLQTVARNFTIKLYGKPCYKGLSPEQVFAGWLFFTPSWTNEPMIKLKGTAKDIIGNGHKYVSYNEFFTNDNYRLSDAIEQIFYGENLNGAKSIREADEKINIIQMLLSRQILDIYPFKTENQLAWHNQNDEMQNDSLLQAISKSVELIGKLAIENDFEGIKRAINNIKACQLSLAQDALPTTGAIKAERLYNSLNLTRTLAMAFVALGILLFAFYVNLWTHRKPTPKALAIMLNCILCTASAYLLLSMALRGFIGGHLPLSNGFETMQFMSLCTLLLTACLQRKFQLVMPFGFLISGLTLMVAMFSESNPQITHLMPVLASPLLSLHVCVLMLAYSMLAFTMLNGITAIIIGNRKRNLELVESLFTISKMMLYPALFLLTAGIFIGAIWANQSWGRYWGWDPKEVWALITMLIYAIPMHASLFPRLQKPMNAHIYLAIAFASVLITYFGVNFLLGGMHSYA